MDIGGVAIVAYTLLDMFWYGYIGGVAIMAYTLPDMFWYGYISGIAIVVHMTEYVIVGYYSKCYHEDRKEFLELILM